MRLKSLRKKFVREVIEKVLEKKFPVVSLSLTSINKLTHLIAILLSARQRDSTVNKSTKALFETCSTTSCFLNLGFEKLNRFLSPIGLNKTKTGYILSLCKLLEQKYNGEVPKTLKSLVSLPGVGPKTALVYLGQMEQKNTFPVDTHVQRLCTKWNLTKKNAKECAPLFTRKNLSKLHLQLLNYGRKICKGKDFSSCLCEICKLKPTYGL